MITDPSLWECWTRLPERVTLVSVPVEFRLEQLRRRHSKFGRCRYLPRICTHAVLPDKPIPTDGAAFSAPTFVLGPRLEGTASRTIKTAQREMCAKNPLSANSSLHSGVCGGSENNDRKHAPSGLRLGDGFAKPLVIMCRCAIRSRARHTTEGRAHRQTHAPLYASKGDEIKRGRG
jgi:hypothetical protein